MFEVLVVVGLVGWIWSEASARRKRQEALEAELARVAARLAALERRAPAAEPERAPAEAPLATVVLPGPPVVPPPPVVPGATAVPPGTLVTPSSSPLTPTLSPAGAGEREPRIAATSTPTSTPTPTSSPLTPTLSPAGAGEREPRTAATPTSTSPPAPPPPRPGFTLASVLSFDWERLVGVKLYSWLAGVAVVVAAVSFARYSIDHGWITAPVRMAIGIAAGLGLLLGGETRRAQAYRVTAQALAAGGVATLFSTFYAAHAIWHLVPALPTFALLALVAAAAVAVAIRRDALVVALLGLLGGFATPALLSTGENRPIGLFSYLLLLNVGLSWVAHRKRWPLLGALSLALTALYQAGWVARFLDGSQLPIAIGAFLVFPIVGFAGVALAHRGPGPGAPRLARLTAAAGAVPPALLALYVAASGDFGAEWPLVLGFLAVVAAGLAAVAAWQGPEWLHLAGAGAVLATVTAFLARSFTPAAWPGLAGFAAIFVALYLGAPALLARLGRPLRAEGRLAVLAAPLVLVVFPVAAARLSEAPVASFFLPLLGLAAACSAVAVIRGDGRVHAIASALLLVALATWSAFHLARGTLLPALLADAAAGLLFLGAPLAAERRGRPLEGGGAGPFLLGGMALLLFLAAGPVAAASLAGLTVLAALFIGALAFEAAHGRTPLLALAGAALGLVAMAVWWVTALAVAVVVPALAAGGALAVVALGGLLWAERGAGAPADRAALRAGPFLGLAGHLFVAWAAASRATALPPWPWLAVLVVLDLAFLAAALLRRRGDLLCGAAVATALAVAVFLLALGIEVPAPGIAAGAAVALGAFGLAGFLAGRRIGAAPAGLGPFALAAALALHGGQVLLLLAALGDGLPLAVLVPAHLALGAGLLAVAWRAPAETLALSGAIAGALAGPALRLGGSADPAAQLWVAAPGYALALAYPLVRGRRGRGERLPFLGAVVASAGFFLLARVALRDLGGAPWLGALPVAQAVLLVPHLVLLVRMDPPSARDQGRLAVVAAAVLALLTVAIPLQLEKQWLTLGWALQAAALVWLWRRIPHRGLLAWSAALFAATFVRLALNPAVLVYHPRSGAPILNWWLYAYLVAVAAFLAGARLAGPDARLQPGWPRLSPLLAAGGGLLLFLLVNVEIADFFSTGDRIVFRFSAGLGQDLTYTIAWALFAIGILAAGVALRSRGTRVAAIALLAATVLKAFLHDLARLDGLYRVGSFVGLAVSLALVAVVLQRFALRGAAPPPPIAPSHPEAR